MRRPASGVLSWCAASARKRFWVAIESFRRVSRSLTDDTSGATSSGTVLSSSGLRSSGLRARMRSSSCDSGLMPRTSASHTSSTASGRMTNCGSITPLMISVASTRALFARLGHLHQRRLRAAAGRAAPRCRRRARPGRASRRRAAAPRRCSGALVLGRQRQVALAAEELAARAQHLVVDEVGVVGAQDLARRLRQVEHARAACCTITSCASAWTLYSSARSNGLPAMLCATSQVSARLTGHSSSSGVSIQSRISPNSERCSALGKSLSWTGRARAGLSRGSSPGSSPGRARWRCGSGPSRSSCAGGGCRPRWRCCSPPRPTRTGARPAGPC